jgi:uncharacterized protein with FMN-binding domain
MRRTLGLVALLVLGIVLLLNPLIGVLGTTGVESTASATSTTPVTTGEPPLDDGEPDPLQDVPPETTITSATTEPPTTTSEAPVANTIVTGPAVGTRFGDFQVEIVVEGGVLVDIATLQEPADRRSMRINQTALLRYEESAIESQSADIDVISGATVTWQAYTESLQAALDAVDL